MQRTLNCDRVGGRPPTSDEAVLLEGYFPSLRRGEYCVTAEEDPSYNCYAFAVGVTDQVADENSIGDRRRPLTYDEIGHFFARHGFAHAAPSAINADIVVYGSIDGPRHAARKTPFLYRGQYLYSSKLGALEEIVHLLEQLVGTEYGAMTRRYARRPLRIERPGGTMIPYSPEPAPFEEPGKTTAVLRRTVDSEAACLPTAPSAEEGGIAYLEQALCESATSSTGSARCVFRPWQRRHVTTARRSAHQLAVEAALGFGARDPHILAMARRIFDVTDLEILAMERTLGRIRNTVFSAQILGGTCADSVCNDTSSERRS